MDSGNGHRTLIDFFVIIPTLNAAPFLDRLLASLVTQVGRFSLHIHVQDGGSTDYTENIVRRWSRWSAKYSCKTQKLGISFRSERDSGLYSAIDLAAKLHTNSESIMTWIGADDVLMPGALATAASIFSQRPEIHWLSGAPHVANNKGEVFTPYPSVSYSRHHLCAGHHDGRTQADGSIYGFVMQEGTFWRRELWNKVGGVNPKLKLAGDWDLWRRFAEHSPLYCVTFPLACFSRRKGQKSSDMEKYYKEVDQTGYRDPPFEEREAMLLKRYPWAHDWQIECQPIQSANKEIAKTQPNWFRSLFFKKRDDL